MCGIVYAYNVKGKPVNNAVMEQFDKQRSRGTQGFGLFDGQEMNIAREVAEDGILKYLVKYDSNLILFHHRMPTSTDNVRRAAHPFTTKTFFKGGQYILVHNGHISNSKELREKHEKLGIQYQSITKDGRFNDSEALLWDFALVMEGKQEKLEARGGMAFVCIKTKKGKPHTLYFARNVNPLSMQVKDNTCMISSVGEGTPITPNMLYTFSYKTNSLKWASFEVPQTVYSYPSGKSDDHYSWNWQNRNYNKSPMVQHIKEPDGQPGDWLPRYLRTKYRHVLNKVQPPSSSNVVIDTDKDGVSHVTENTVCSTEYESYDDWWLQQRGPQLRAQGQLALGSGLTDEQDEESEAMYVDPEEVYQRAFEYIVQGEGNFEKSYFLAESDYEQLFDVSEKMKKDADYLYEVRLMEGVLEAINGDPEYNDEHSISSMWLPLEQALAV